MTVVAYHAEPDLAGFLELPAAGTLSRTLFQDDLVKVVVFGFAAGEELSEHTASRPAIVQVLRGELALTLAGEPVTAREGAWIHMAAGLRHAVHARVPSLMLLTLLGPAS